SVERSDLSGVDLASGDDLTPSGPWVQEPINSTSIDLNAVWGSSATDVYAVGDSGAVYHSKGDANWVYRTTSSNPLYGVWGSSATDVYAVSSLGEIWHSAGDDNWSPVTGVTLPAAYAIWGNSADEIYVACNGGVIFEKMGAAWSTVQTSSNATFTA